MSGESSMKHKGGIKNNYREMKKGSNVDPFHFLDKASLPVALPAPTSASGDGVWSAGNRACEGVWPACGCSASVPHPDSTRKQAGALRAAPPPPSHRPPVSRCLSQFHEALHINPSHFYTFVHHSCAWMVELDLFIFGGDKREANFGRVTTAEWKTSTTERIKTHISKLFSL